MRNRVSLAIICGVLAALVAPVSGFASRTATAAPTAEPGITCNGATQTWTVTWLIHVTELKAVRVTSDNGTGIYFGEIEAGGSRFAEPVHVPGNTTLSVRIEYTDPPWDDSRIQTGVETVTLGPCPVVLQPPPPSPTNGSGGSGRTGSGTGTDRAQKPATPAQPGQLTGPATVSQPSSSTTQPGPTGSPAAVVAASQASDGGGLGWAVGLSAGVVVLAAALAAVVLIRRRAAA